MAGSFSSRAPWPDPSAAASRFHQNPPHAAAPQNQSHTPLLPSHPWPRPGCSTWRPGSPLLSNRAFPFLHQQQAGHHQAMAAPARTAALFSSRCPLLLGAVQTSNATSSDCRPRSSRPFPFAAWPSPLGRLHFHLRPAPDPTEQQASQVPQQTRTATNNSWHPPTATRQPRSDLQRLSRSSASSGEQRVLLIRANPSSETSTVAFSSTLATLPCSPIARNDTTAIETATRPATRSFPM